METSTPSHLSPPSASPSPGRRGRSVLTRGRKGQSLVEFALMLPFLLLLIFMIIEFGRMFQTWVTLQNSARAAARYTSTGQVNYDLFDLGAPLPAEGKDLVVLNAIVPCSPNDDGGNDLGTKTVVRGVETYSGNDGLFATWYDGTDCDPTQEDHLQYRKDLLRLISVMNEAREAVNALGAETLPDSDDHYFEKLNAAETQDLLYSYWDNPMARENERAWFNVTICSSRGLLDPVARTPATIHPNIRDSRFITVRSDSDLTGVAAADMPEPYPMPYCLLNEIPPPQMSGSTGPYTALNHAGLRWLDAGSPGDRVTIAVTFNHPLITPIRPDDINYLTMRARRSIVNESFRAPKSTRILANPKVVGSQGGSGSLVTATETSPSTATPSATSSETPTNTPSATPPTFDCAAISAIWGSPPFELNNIQLFINNQNLLRVELQSVFISWKDIAAPWNNMWLGVMSLDSDVHWAGTEAQNAKAGGITSVTTGQLTDGYRFVLPQSGAVWQGTFFNGPSQMEDEMTLYDFSATFVLTSETGITCTIELIRPPLGEPTDPPPPPTDGPTPTNTPNCVTATGKVNLKFGGFGSFGGVWFDLTNNSGRDLILTGFDVVWPDATHPDIDPPTNGYGLAKVIVGGDSVVAPDGQRVWQANPPVKPGNKNKLKPYNNRTVSNQKGTWLGNATLPVGTTRIYLDFDTITGKLSDFDAKNYHFDTSRFRIACQGGAGTGGGGDSDDGDVGVDIPTPKPSNTPKATPTKGPTNTAGPATATRTATKTRTPGPSNTPTKTSQATFTPSRTPFVQPTESDSGGGE
jgi:hypothetical protein